MTPEHARQIRALARDRGWSRHKVKSVRGQMIAMRTDEEREAYLRKIAKK